MKTPSLEEVKAHFKDVKEVKCLADGDIYVLDFTKRLSIEKESVFLDNQKCHNYICLSACCLWKDGQYAEIVSYKTETNESAKSNHSVKQYKHIPTGNAWQKSQNGKTYTSSNWQNYRIPAIIVENSSDWEEVKPKEHEVISVISNIGVIWEKKNQDNIFYRKDGCAWAKIDFFDNFWKIHSVKRLSDGEVFTVGDMTTKGKIHGFDIVSGVLSVRVGDQATLLRTFEKTNPVLFTTKDGVEIRQGDKFYVVDEKYGKFKMHDTIGGHFTKEHKHRKRFSNKEKASEYVLMNKPCLSVNDAMKILDYYTDVKKYWTNDEFNDSLVELAKSKIADQQ